MAWLDSRAERSATSQAPACRRVVTRGRKRAEDECETHALGGCTSVIFALTDNPSQSTARSSHAWPCGPAEYGRRRYGSHCVPSELTLAGICTADVDLEHFVIVLCGFVVFCPLTDNPSQSTARSSHAWPCGPAEYGRRRYGLARLSGRGAVPPESRAKP
jgi:hypothetical protein